MPEPTPDTWQHVGEPVGRIVDKVLRAAAERREAERREAGQEPGDG